ncbi:MAG: DUF3160 domain-containing protein [Synergistaceae bacterium]|jgi:hypothetical protein|nr:DUF3160 domain-containing protein [Synergistaceae bacterium]
MKSYPRVFILTLLALAAFGPRQAAGDYTAAVVAEVLPIMTSPDKKYEITDGEVYGEDVEGVVVYGNRLKLRDSNTKGWSELISPEDGSTLGYVETKGLERFPDYSAGDGEYYMALKDAPELVLRPGKKDKKNNLSSYGYSLLKGEVVLSKGTRGDLLLLSFGTDLRTGAGGVGARYAWGRKKDFIALNSYKPNNGKVDLQLIPSGMRAKLVYDASGGHVVKIPSGLFERIARHGFAIDPKPALREYIQVDDMADSYNETDDYEVDFVTTDIFLHAFHLIFDHTLQKLERVYLAPALNAGLKAAVSELTEIKGALSGDALSSWETAHDMFSISLSLLEDAQNSTPGFSSRAAGELLLIRAAEGITDSPLTGQKLDYTLFKPRGHYTLTPEFQRYFRAMSYIGAAELSLFKETEDKTLRPILENVRTAALISLVLDAQEKSWEAFEEPIGFLVGVPNSGDPKAFRALARKRLGEPGKVESYKNLSDEARLSALAEDIRIAIKGPMIQSVIKIDKADSDFENRAPVFRISGKRFTWDAYVMNRLTSPRVGTDELPRNIPEGTDIMAALGSDAADEYSRKNDSVISYRENLEALKSETADYLSKERTVYARWLSTFAAGFRRSGSEQFFYNAPAWRWKKVSTYLASWAEMKHDTILYAEQSAAEMGDGGWYAGRFAPPEPRGYVEPDPQVFGALLKAVEELAAFIDKYDMEPPPSEEDENFMRTYSCKEKLRSFATLLEGARDIAQKEAEGAEITPEDYMTIKTIARGFLGEMLLPETGQFYGDDALEQLKMALVADAATNGQDMTALEVATGTPRKIYVFVNDKPGGARLARGYVYSYYEFERPLSEGRMTNEEWKDVVYDPARAEELEKYRPAWRGELEK